MDFHSDHSQLTSTSSGTCDSKIWSKSVGKWLSNEDVKHVRVKQPIKICIAGGKIGGLVVGEDGAEEDAYGVATIITALYLLRSCVMGVEIRHAIGYGLDIEFMGVEIRHTARVGTLDLDTPTNDIK
jgi:hypothetical protein